MVVVMMLKTQTTARKRWTASRKQNETKKMNFLWHYLTNKSWWRYNNIVLLRFFPILICWCWCTVVPHPLLLTFFWCKTIFSIYSFLVFPFILFCCCCCCCFLWFFFFFSILGFKCFFQLQFIKYSCAGHIRIVIYGWCCGFYLLLALLSFYFGYAR